ncbi:MAG: 1,6-anhydro-N-acetylmuramyl-L-alanine amidase AmpD [Pseudomonadota bacterium]
MNSTPRQRSRGRIQVDPQSGCVTGAVQRHSPNQDPRPDGVVPSLVVLHGISLPPGCFGTGDVHALFTNCLAGHEDSQVAALSEVRVSSHLLIERDGHLSQYVPLTARAWHAGPSCYFGREACNDFSIGIELEGTDATPYETAQYDTLVEVLGAIFAAWPGTLGPQRVVGHCDIAPGRKTDPGVAFDWPALFSRLTTSDLLAAGRCSSGRSCT